MEMSIGDRVIPDHFTNDELKASREIHVFSGYK